MTSKLDGYVGWATQMARHQVRIRLCFQNFPSQVGSRLACSTATQRKGARSGGPTCLFLASHPSYHDRHLGVERSLEAGLRTQGIFQVPYQAQVIPASPPLSWQDGLCV